MINEFLGYVADRGYSPRTERAYAFDLLAFARWLVDQDLTVGEVTTDALLRFLTFCRAMVLPGQAGGNVVPLRTGRSTGYAPSTINRRMAAISGLFDFRAMRDPALVNPVPRSAAARRSSTAQRGGLLAHLDRPKSRSRLRVREPRRLPRGLDRAETAALLGSFRSDRDRAIAGLMLFSGLRSAEVLTLQVRDVDIPRRWVRVVGKGDKERTVPLDVDVAGLVQTYLLAERPESASTTLFLVAKGSHRGQPLTPAGLRHGVPVSPGRRRGAGRSSTRTAALVRYLPCRCWLRDVRLGAKAHVPDKYSNLCRCPELRSAGDRFDEFCVPGRACGVPGGRQRVVGGA